jgi:hypothetical protein
MEMLRKATVGQRMTENGKENEPNGSTSFRYQEVVRCQHERGAAANGSQHEGLASEWRPR